MYLNNFYKVTNKEIYLDKFQGKKHSYKSNVFYMNKAINISNDEYPYIKTMGIENIENNKIRQIYNHKNKMIKNKNGDIYENSFLITKLDNSDKIFCSYGDNLIIMPDKIAYDGYKTENLEKTFLLNDAKIYLCDENASPIDSFIKSNIEPENKALWLDTSTNKLKRYANGQYEIISSIYIAIEHTAIDEKFIEGEAVSLEFEDKSLNGIYTIEKTGKNFISVLCTISEVKSGIVKIQKNIPNMHNMCVWQNRLWGINDSNEICASALNSPYNFYSFRGLSSDSYTISLDEKAISIFPFSDELIIFCEKCIYKLFGTRPQNYSVQKIEGVGINKSTKNSIALVNSKLFFIYNNSLYSYNGIIQNLYYKINTKEVKATSTGSKYIFTTDEGIYCYDDLYNTLSTYSENKATHICNVNNKIYFLIDDNLYTFNENNAKQWYLETQDLNNSFDEIFLKSIEICIIGSGTLDIYANKNKLKSINYEDGVIKINTGKRLFKNLIISIHGFGTAMIKGIKIKYLVKEK